MSRWTPDEGEIIWIQLDPQVGREQLGREQAGHRPAIVLTPADYNRKSGLLLCVPLTTRIKGYPFEVAIAREPSSVALVDHVKSLDWSRRRAKPKGRVDPTELEEVRQTLRALIG